MGIVVAWIDPNGHFLENMMVWIDPNGHSLENVVVGIDVVALKI